jgi:hypothetical protein
MAGVLAAWRPDFSSRSPSGPATSAPFRPPESSRFAAVVGFSTTLITTVFGSPLVAVVAPLGPHV